MHRRKDPPVLQRISQWILYFILRCLSWSYRIEAYGLEHYEEALTMHPSKAYLLAFWHEHLLPPLFYFEGTPHCVLTSDSKDGQIIGFQCEKFGNPVVHGSQNRGGKDKGGIRALIGLLAQLRKGLPVAITVDGSIGPRHYVKAGVIDLARKSGVPIVPFAAAASRFWTLNTWDQFKIPKPFSKIHVRFGSPIPVSKDLSKEEMPAMQDIIAKAIHEQEDKAKDSMKRALKDS